MTRTGKEGEGVAVKATRIDNLLERASDAAKGGAIFEAERMLIKAVNMAREKKDHGRLAAAAGALKDVRAARVERAFATGRVRVLDEPIQEETPIEAGCYLVRPPLVGADARQVRLRALTQDAPAAVVCREPTTRTGLVPIVAIGGATVRVKVKPPRDADAPDIDWLREAMEALGDGAIEDVDPGQSATRRLEALLDRLDAVPEHEGLHDAVIAAAEAAAAEAEAEENPGRSRKRKSSNAA